MVNTSQHKKGWSWAHGDYFLYHPLFFSFRFFGTWISPVSYNGTIASYLRGETHLIFKSGLLVHESLNIRRLCLKFYFMELIYSSNVSVVQSAEVSCASQWLLQMLRCVLEKNSFTSRKKKFLLKMLSPNLWWVPFFSIDHPSIHLYARVHVTPRDFYLGTWAQERASQSRWGVGRRQYRKWEIVTAFWVWYIWIYNLLHLIKTNPK